VLVLAPEGDLLGELLIPGAVNFTFGGEDGNVLFVTADTAVWAASLAATGPMASRSNHPNEIRIGG
jgi:sugar lactone lactonase YvrE